MYIVTVNGFQVKCESAEEAVRLTKVAAKTQDVVVAGSIGRRKGRETAASSNGSGTNVQTITVLRTVHEAKSIPPATLSKTLSLPDPRSLGHVWPQLRDDLKRIGFQMDDVLVKRRLGTVRQWMAGAKIEEAIKKLESQ